MVSPNFLYLQSLPLPTALREVSYATILSEIIAVNRQLLPDWDGDPDDPLYKASENFAYREFLLRQRHNANIRACLFTFMEGSDADNFVSLAGITRLTGETTIALKARYLNTLFGISGGTESYVIAQTYLAGVTLSDVQITTAVGSTGIDVTVYALGADTAAERETIRAYLSHRDRLILGDVITVSAVTESSYTITCTVTYSSTETDLVGLQTRVTAAINTFIDANRKIGNTIYRSAIAAAIRNVDGVLDVSIQSPATNIAGVDGTAHSGDKDATGVTYNT